MESPDTYISLGFGLVPIPLGTKRPTTTGWQNHPITTSEGVEQVWHKPSNIGLHHAASGTVALDIDNPEYATLALAAVGIDLHALLTAPGAKIRTLKGLKPIYRSPKDVTLNRKAYTWKLPNRKTITLFEIRAGPVQDLLPPSMHPEGLRYKWEPAAPRNREEIPELPTVLLDLYQNWSVLKHTMDMANPFAPAPPARHWQGEGVSVIDAFNRRFSVCQVLERKGYRRVGQGRFLSPHSSTGTPGIVLLTGDDGIERVFCHHASDPLYSDEHSHDAFSVFCILVHGGDQRAAVRAAAQALGLGHEVAQKPAPSVKMEEKAESTADAKTAPPFPLEVLPTPLGRLCTEAASALPCPPDFLAVTMIALAGAAIGTSRVLEVKPGWREGARIFAAIVADPGARKSPAFRLAAEPFHERQRQAHIEYRQARDAYELELAEFERERLAWRASKGASPMPTPPVEPRMAQCFTTDATLESLVGLLVDNPRGLILLQDELSAWVKGMGQYKGGKGNDRQKWLSFWSGSPEVVNRKGQEPLVLPNPFVNVVGNLPPDVLGELSDDLGREDGFTHRLLFSYPEPVALVWSEAAVSPETRAAYQSVIDTLWNLEPAVTDDEHAHPKVLHFSPAGRTAFTGWVSDHFNEMNHPEFSPRLRGPWAKLEGYAVRFALILHLLRQAAGETASVRIDEVSVLGASALVGYFKNHARRAYGSLHSTPLEKQVAAVSEYLKRQPGQRISLRDLLRSGAGKLRDAKGMRVVLEHMQAQGQGRFIEITYPSGQKGEGFELSN
jgi:hypothetical protein